MRLKNNKHEEALTDHQLRVQMRWASPDLVRYYDRKNKGQTSALMDFNWALT